MNYSEFTALLKKQINALERKRQLEFAIDICKKLFFHYQHFYEINNWGNPDLLIDGINLCGKALQGPVDSHTLESLIAEIELVTPDMDDFGDVEGSYALNASASVVVSLQFLQDNKSEHIYHVATFYTDTIDFQIHEEDELTEEQIDKHPSMMEARNFLINATK